MSEKFIRDFLSDNGVELTPFLDDVFVKLNLFSFNTLRLLATHKYQQIVKREFLAKIAEFEAHYIKLRVGTNVDEYIAAKSADTVGLDDVFTLRDFSDLAGIGAMAVEHLEKNKKFPQKTKKRKAENELSTEDLTIK